MNKRPSKEQQVMSDMLDVLKHMGTRYMIGESAFDVLEMSSLKDFGNNGKPLDIHIDVPMATVMNLMNKYAVSYEVVDSDTIGMTLRNKWMRLHCTDQDIYDYLLGQDFTIDAVAIKLPLSICNDHSFICDLFEGIKDHSMRVIATVKDPDETIQKDPSVMLRAIKLAVEKEYSIDHKLYKAMKRNAALVDTDEMRMKFAGMLQSILTSGKPITRVFSDFDFLVGTLIPPLKACIGVSQNSKYHKHNIYEHCLAVCDYCESNKLEIKLAALLHDVGKPDAYSEDEEGHGHFYGHPEQSYDIAFAYFITDGVKALPDTRGSLDRVLALIRYHDMKVCETKRSVRKALHTYGEDFMRDWFVLRQADICDHIYPDVPVRPSVEKRLRIMEDLLNEQNKSLSNLAINGYDVMRECKLLPGKQVGKILWNLWERVMSGELANDRDVLIKEVKAVNSNGS